MAEFILFWKAHYMDAWDAEKVASLDTAAKAKYDRRYQKGDIIEVCSDGEGEQRIGGNRDFAVAKVPGMVVDKDHMGALMDGTTVLKRRKWSFPVAKIPAAILVEMNKENIATVNLAQFQNLEILTRVQRSIEGFVPPVLEAKG